MILLVACPPGCLTCVINANGGTTCTTGGCNAVSFAQVVSTSCVGKTILP